jgi:hypothetical protein
VLFAVPPLPVPVDGPVRLFYNRAKGPLPWDSNVSVCAPPCFAGPGRALHDTPITTTLASALCVLGASSHTNDFFLPCRSSWA